MDINPLATILSLVGLWAELATQRSVFGKTVPVDAVTVKLCDGRPSQVGFKGIMITRRWEETIDVDVRRGQEWNREAGDYTTVIATVKRRLRDGETCFLTLPMDKEELEEYFWTTEEELGELL